MRPDASKLLQHPFVAGKHFLVDTAKCTPDVDDRISLQLQTANLDKFQNSCVSDTTDICNLGSLSDSLDPKKLSESNGICGTCNSDDDLCQIEKDDFASNELKISPLLASESFNNNSDAKDVLSEDWRCRFGENSKLEEAGSGPVTDIPAECVSISEEDDELTESKIRAFLDEKALELKKLQTPLYEEFYNSLNAACSPSFANKPSNETSPNYLKLPPKGRSPGRIPIGTPPVASDIVSSGSPGINSRHSPNVGHVDEQASDETSSPQGNDHKGLLVEDCPESSSPSCSEQQRRWKEELDQELERKREMMRLAGSAGKTLSPKDRAFNRQRERTRFASPSK